MGVPYVIVYVECDRLGVKSCKLLVVSVCALVAVYSDMGCLVVEGIHVGTSGGWVRYIRRMLSLPSTGIGVVYL